MKTTIKKKNDFLRELIVKLTWDDIKSDYINEFKKHKLMYRKYTNLGLVIVKMKYNYT